MPEDESNLVAHARRELELVGEDPDVIEWYLRVVQEFASFGHSGGSAAVTTQVLGDLLQFKNLRPLTDNPEEWYHHGGEVWGEAGGIWQNIRNSEAFSKDGGKTYHLNSEYENGQAPLHHSQPYEKKEN